MLPLMLMACGCPPKVIDYTTPEATLRTWQAHLCADLPSEEYACFAAQYAKEFGGYGNYIAFREHLLDDQPVLAHIVARNDLSDNIIGFGIESDGVHGWALLAAVGRRLRLEFVREVWVRITFRDGRHDIVARQRPSFPGLLNLDGQRQWLLIDRPELDQDDVTQIASIGYESRWLISHFGADVAP